MTIASLKRVLLHGGSDEGFDDSVRFARRLVEGFGADLHVVYTVQEPLSAGWTAEVVPTKLVELHQAIEAEARERLARVIPEYEADVTIAIRTGDPSIELVLYTAEHTVDLAIIQGDDEHARALLEKGHCSVLVLKR